MLGRDTPQPSTGAVLGGSGLGEVLGRDALQESPGAVLGGSEPKDIPVPILSVSERFAGGLFGGNQDAIASSAVALTFDPANILLVGLIGVCHKPLPSTESLLIIPRL